jgi:hypothetical protein
MDFGNTQGRVPKGERTGGFALAASVALGKLDGRMRERHNCSSCVSRETLVS